MSSVMKGSALTQPAASCASRVRPFTAAKGGRRSVQPSKQSVVARAAEPEAEAAPAPEQAVVVEDDFKFSYADAKRQNQYEASDVEVALNFYQERSFEVPTSLPYEQETFTNRLGGEDAAFFDDYDNNQYYKVDGYASAGIPEAAPKVKREGRGGQQEEEEGDEEAFRELEDSKLMAAAYDEMGFDEADLDVADGETPWDWNESESTVVSTTAAAASSNVEANEQAIMDDLSRLDLESNQEIPLEDRDAMSLILDPELLNDVDNDDEVDDGPLPPLDASAQLTPEEEAEIEALLAEDLPTLESLGLGGEEALSVEFTERVEGGLDPAAVAQYLSALKAFNPDAAGASAEEVVAMLGAEQPVPLSATTDIPTLDDLPALPDVSATLALPDPALPAALDRESLEQDAAAVRSVQADVSVVEGVQMLDMDPGSLPLAEDLEMYADVVKYAEDVLSLNEEAFTEEVTNREADAPVNMYDSIDPSLVRTPLAAELADSEEAGLVERILELNRVTKVVKGGKLQGFRCVCVVGNGAGRVGVGVQAGRDIGTAVKRALVDAKKNMVTVPLVGAGTLPHRVEVWFKAAGVVMLPAREGTGVIAGGAVRSVLEVAGVKNVLAKRLGGRSALNNARATIKALGSLRTMEDYAEGRGIPVEYMLS